eukprot:g7525.t1
MNPAPGKKAGSGERKTVFDLEDVRLRHNNAFSVKAAIDILQSRLATVKETSGIAENGMPLFRLRIGTSTLSTSSRETEPNVSLLAEVSVGLIDSDDLGLPLNGDEVYRLTSLAKTAATLQMSEKVAASGKNKPAAGAGEKVKFVQTTSLLSSSLSNCGTPSHAAPPQSGSTASAGSSAAPPSTSAAAEKERARRSTAAPVDVTKLGLEGRSERTDEFLRDMQVKIGVLRWLRANIQSILAATVSDDALAKWIAEKSGMTPEQALSAWRELKKHIQSDLGAEASRKGIGRPSEDGGRAVVDVEIDEERGVAVETVVFPGYRLENYVPGRGAPGMTLVNGVDRAPAAASAAGSSAGAAQGGRGERAGRRGSNKMTRSPPATPSTVHQKAPRQVETVPVDHLDACQRSLLHDMRQRIAELFFADEASAPDVDDPLTLARRGELEAAVLSKTDASIFLFPSNARKMMRLKQTPEGGDEAGGFVLLPENWSDLSSRLAEKLAKYEVDLGKACELDEEIGDGTEADAEARRAAREKDCLFVLTIPTSEQSGPRDGYATAGLVVDDKGKSSVAVAAAAGGGEDLGRSIQEAASDTLTAFNSDAATQETRQEAVQSLHRALASADNFLKQATGDEIQNPSLTSEVETRGKMVEDRAHAFVDALVNGDEHQHFGKDPESVSKLKRELPAAFRQLAGHIEDISRATSEARAAGRTTQEIPLTKPPASLVQTLRELSEVQVGDRPLKDIAMQHLSKELGKMSIQNQEKYVMKSHSLLARLEGTTAASAGDINLHRGASCSSSIVPEQSGARRVAAEQEGESLQEHQAGEEAIWLDAEEDATESIDDLHSDKADEAHDDEHARNVMEHVYDAVVYDPQSATASVETPATWGFAVPCSQVSVPTQSRGTSSDGGDGADADGLSMTSDVTVAPATMEPPVEEKEGSRGTAGSEEEGRGPTTPQAQHERTYATSGTLDACCRKAQREKSCTRLPPGRWHGNNTFHEIKCAECGRACFVDAVSETEHQGLQLATKIPLQVDPRRFRWVYGAHPPGQLRGLVLGRRRVNGAQEQAICSGGAAAQEPEASQQQLHTVISTICSKLGVGQADVDSIDVVGARELVPEMGSDVATIAFDRAPSRPGGSLVTSPEAGAEMTDFLFQDEVAEHQSSPDHAGRSPTGTRVNELCCTGLGNLPLYVLYYFRDQYARDPEKWCIGIKREEVKPTDRKERFSRLQQRNLLHLVPNWLLEESRKVPNLPQEAQKELLLSILGTAGVAVELGVGSTWVVTGREYLWESVGVRPGWSLNDMTDALLKAVHADLRLLNSSTQAVERAKTLFEKLRDVRRIQFLMHPPLPAKEQQTEERATDRGEGQIDFETSIGQSSGFTFLQQYMRNIFTDLFQHHTVSVLLQRDWPVRNFPRYVIHFADFIELLDRKLVKSNYIYPTLPPARKAVWWYSLSPGSAVDAFGRALLRPSKQDFEDYHSGKRDAVSVVTAAVERAIKADGVDSHPGMEARTAKHLGLARQPAEGAVAESASAASAADDFLAKVEDMDATPSVTMFTFVRAAALSTDANDAAQNPLHRLPYYDKDEHRDVAELVSEVLAEHWRTLKEWAAGTGAAASSPPSPRRAGSLDVSRTGLDAETSASEARPVAGEGVETNTKQDLHAGDKFSDAQLASFKKKTLPKTLKDFGQWFTHPAMIVFPELHAFVETLKATKKVTDIRAFSTYEWHRNASPLDFSETACLERSGSLFAVNLVPTADEWLDLHSTFDRMADMAERDRAPQTRGTTSSSTPAAAGSKRSGDVDAAKFIPGVTAGSTYEYFAAHTREFQQQVDVRKLLAASFPCSSAPATAPDAPASRGDAAAASVNLLVQPLMLLARLLGLKGYIDPVFSRVLYFTDLTLVENWRMAFEASDPEKRRASLQAKIEAVQKELKGLKKDAQSPSAAGAAASAAGSPQSSQTTTPGANKKQLRNRKEQLQQELGELAKTAEKARRITYLLQRLGTNKKQPRRGLLGLSKLIDELDADQKAKAAGAKAGNSKSKTDFGNATAAAAPSTRTGRFVVTPASSSPSAKTVLMQSGGNVARAAATLAETTTVMTPEEFLKEVESGTIESRLSRGGGASAASASSRAPRPTCEDPASQLYPSSAAGSSARCRDVAVAFHGANSADATADTITIPAAASENKAGKSKDRDQDKQGESEYAATGTTCAEEVEQELGAATTRESSGSPSSKRPILFSNLAEALEKELRQKEQPSMFAPAEQTDNQQRLKGWRVLEKTFADEPRISDALSMWTTSVDPRILNTLRMSEQYKKRIFQEYAKNMQRHAIWAKLGKPAKNQPKKMAPVTFFVPVTELVRTLVCLHAMGDTIPEETIIWKRKAKGEPASKPEAPDPTYWDFDATVHEYITLHRPPRSQTQDKEKGDRTLGAACDRVPKRVVAGEKWRVGGRGCSSDAARLMIDLGSAIGVAAAMTNAELDYAHTAASKIVSDGRGKGGKRKQGSSFAEKIKEVKEPGLVAGLDPLRDPLVGQNLVLCTLSDRIGPENDAELVFVLVLVFEVEAKYKKIAGRNQLATKNRKKSADVEMLDAAPQDASSADFKMKASAPSRKKSVPSLLSPVDEGTTPVHGPPEIREDDEGPTTPTAAEGPPSSPAAKPAARNSTGSGEEQGRRFPPQHLAEEYLYDHFASATEIGRPTARITRERYRAIDLISEERAELSSGKLQLYLWGGSTTDSAADRLREKRLLADASLLHPDAAETVEALSLSSDSGYVSQLNSLMGSQDCVDGMQDVIGGDRVADGDELPSDEAEMLHADRLTRSLRHEETVEQEQARLIKSLTKTPKDMLRSGLVVSLRHALHESMKDIDELHKEHKAYLLDHIRADLIPEALAAWRRVEHFVDPIEYRPMRTGKDFAEKSLSGLAWKTFRDEAGVVEQPGKAGTAQPHEQHVVESVRIKTAQQMNFDRAVARMKTEAMRLELWFPGMFGQLNGAGEGVVDGGKQSNAAAGEQWQGRRDGPGKLFDAALDRLEDTAREIDKIIQEQTLQGDEQSAGGGGGVATPTPDTKSALQGGGKSSRGDASDRSAFWAKSFPDMRSLIVETDQRMIHFSQEFGNFVATYPRMAAGRGMTYVEANKNLSDHATRRAEAGRQEKPSTAEETAEDMQERSRRVFEQIATEMMAWRDGDNPNAIEEQEILEEKALELERKERSLAVTQVSGAKAKATGAPGVAAAEATAGSGATGPAEEKDLSQGEKMKREVKRRRTTRMAWRRKRLQNLLDMFEHIAELSQFVLADWPKLLRLKMHVRDEGKNKNPIGQFGGNSVHGISDTMLTPTEIFPVDSEDALFFVRATLGAARAMRRELNADARDIFLLDEGLSHVTQNVYDHWFGDVAHMATRASHTLEKWDGLLVEKYGETSGTPCRSLLDKLRQKEEAKVNKQGDNIVSTEEERRQQLRQKIKRNLLLSQAATGKESTMSLLSGAGWEKETDEIRQCLLNAFTVRSSYPATSLFWTAKDLLQAERHARLTPGASEKALHARDMIVARMNKVERRPDAQTKRRADAVLVTLQQERHRLRGVLRDAVESREDREEDVDGREVGGLSTGAGGEREVAAAAEKGASARPKEMSEEDFQKQVEREVAAFIKQHSSRFRGKQTNVLTADCKSAKRCVNCYSKQNYDWRLYAWSDRNPRCCNEKVGKYATKMALAVLAVVYLYEDGRVTLYAKMTMLLYLFGKSSAMGEAPGVLGGNEAKNTARETKTDIEEALEEFPRDFTAFVNEVTCLPTTAEEIHCMEEHEKDAAHVSVMLHSLHRHFSHERKSDEKKMEQKQERAPPFSAVSLSEHKVRGGVFGRHYALAVSIKQQQQAAATLNKKHNSRPLPSETEQRMSDVDVAVKTETSRPTKTTIFEEIAEEETRKSALGLPPTSRDLGIGPDLEVAEKRGTAAALAQLEKSEFAHLVRAPLGHVSELDRGGPSPLFLDLTRAWDHNPELMSLSPEEGGDTMLVRAQDASMTHARAPANTTTRPPARGAGVSAMTATLDATSEETQPAVRVAAGPPGSASSCSAAASTAGRADPEGAADSATPGRANSLLLEAFHAQHHLDSLQHLHEQSFRSEIHEPWTELMNDLEAYDGGGKLPKISERKTFLKKVEEATRAMWAEQQMKRAAEKQGETVDKQELDAAGENSARHPAAGIKEPLTVDTGDGVVTATEIGYVGSTPIIELTPGGANGDPAPIDANAMSALFSKLLPQMLEGNKAAAKTGVVAYEKTGPPAGRGQKQMKGAAVGNPNSIAQSSGGGGPLEEEKPGKNSEAAARAKSHSAIAEDSLGERLERHKVLFSKMFDKTDSVVRTAIEATLKLHHALSRLYRLTFYRTKYERNLYPTLFESMREDADFYRQALLVETTANLDEHWYTNMWRGNILHVAESKKLWESMMAVSLPDGARVEPPNVEQQRDGVFRGSAATMVEHLEQAGRGLSPTSAARGPDVLPEPLREVLDAIAGDVKSDFQFATQPIMLTGAVHDSVPVRGRAGSLDAAGAGSSNDPSTASCAGDSNVGDLSTTAAQSSSTCGGTTTDGSKTTAGGDIPAAAAAFDPERVPVSYALVARLEDEVELEKAEVAALEKKDGQGTASSSANTPAWPEPKSLEAAAASYCPDLDRTPLPEGDMARYTRLWDCLGYSESERAELVDFLSQPPMTPGEQKVYYNSMLRDFTDTLLSHAREHTAEVDRKAALGKRKFLLRKSETKLKELRQLLRFRLDRLLRDAASYLMQLGYIRHKLTSEGGVDSGVPSSSMSPLSAGKNNFSATGGGPGSTSRSAQQSSYLRAASSQKEKKKYEELSSEQVKYREGLEEAVQMLINICDGLPTATWLQTVRSSPTGDDADHKSDSVHLQGLNYFFFVPDWSVGYSRFKIYWDRNTRVWTANLSEDANTLPEMELEQLPVAELEYVLATGGPVVTINIEERSEAHRYSDSQGASYEDGTMIDAVRKHAQKMVAHYGEANAAEPASPSGSGGGTPQGSCSSGRRVLHYFYPRPVSRGRERLFWKSAEFVPGSTWSDGRVEDLRSSALQLCRPGGLSFWSDRDYPSGRPLFLVDDMRMFTRGHSGAVGISSSAAGFGDHYALKMLPPGGMHMTSRLLADAGGQAVDKTQLTSLCDAIEELFKQEDQQSLSAEEIASRHAMLQDLVLYRTHEHVAQAESRHEDSKIQTGPFLLPRLLDYVGARFDTATALSQQLERALPDLRMVASSGDAGIEPSSGPRGGSPRRSASGAVDLLYEGSAPGSLREVEQELEACGRGRKDIEPLMSAYLATLVQLPDGDAISSAEAEQRATQAANELLEMEELELQLTNASLRDKKKGPAVSPKKGGAKGAASAAPAGGGSGKKRKGRK